MAKFSKIELKNLLKKLEIFKKNIGLVFWLILLFLIIFELFAVKTSISQIVASYEEPEIVSKEKGVRIDFESYNQVVGKIERGKDFEVENRAAENPFGL